MTARVKAFLPRHKLSWAVGVLLLAAMVLIVVPGVHQPQVSYGFDPQANPPLLTTDSSATAVYYDYTHGWPYAFARRWVGYDLSFLATRTNRASLTYPGGREISWSIPDAWPWQSDRLELSWPALVADLLIAMAIIGGGVGATELWLRRRGRLRFRIVDVVVVVSLGSLFLGWRQWHINTQRAEFELVSSLFGVQEAPPSRFGLHPLVDMRKLTPVGHDSMRWFTRLVGTSRLLEWRFHRESLCITDYAIERYSTKDLKSLHGLRYLDSLFLFYSPTATLLEKTTIPDTVRNLAIVNNDRHIRRIVENPRKLADETIDLSTLAQLPNLENLRVSTRWC